MLSYQHGYHAGNFADVHKHLIFTLVLDYLAQKPAPFTVLDVYAGRGEYRLDSDAARKTGEATRGVIPLWDKRPWPAEARPYQQALAALNPSAELSRYPGSPALARNWLRGDDRLVLCELHPTEHAELKRLMAGQAGCQVHQRDALEALIALTPPEIRRGCVLVDPSYEVKSDYRAVAHAIREGLVKWPEASWLLWYPLLPGQPHRALLSALKGLGKRGQLKSEVCVRQPGAGMHGSGMLVINPPWRLAEQLQNSREWLSGLGENEPAIIVLEVESTS